MSQQVACRHLRTGAVYGTGYMCRISGKYVECLGFLRRCECPEARVVHDRHAAPESIYVKLARRSR